MRGFVLVRVLSLLIATAGICHAGEARVERFSPLGLAKGVRQVAALFSEPMTTFGDPGNLAPFTVDCPEKGNGHWLDVRSWVYDFDRDLPAGVSCSFSLREGLATLAGSAVGGERVFSFTTGGPAIVSARPADGRTVEEDQIFILTLDGVPDEQSILANTRFVVEGLSEPVGVEIVKGPDRAAVLKAAQKKDEPSTVTLRCRQHFPSNAAIKLVWGPGVRTTTGVASDIEQVFGYTAREEFTVSFSCERTNADAPCLPITPMRVRFSSPVPASLAAKVLLKSGHKSYRPDLVDEEGQQTAAAVHGVKFKPPFPVQGSLTLELPADLADEAGRAPANRSDFPLKLKTDTLPPLAKFAAPFGIVELNANPAIPVTLRNLEPKVKAREISPLPEAPPAPAAGKPAAASKAQGAPSAGIKGKRHTLSVGKEKEIIEWLRKVRAARRDKPLLKGRETRSFTVPKPNGEKAFEVVGIPVPKPGFHVVELESPALGAALLAKRGPMYVSSAALVTNLSAHFKQGRESSLVWVTTLDQGAPVPGAAVSIRDCKGKVRWQGKTDADGIARIPEKLGEIPYCSEESSSRKKKDEDEDTYSDNNEHMLQGISGGLYVFARKGEDLTFVHSSWDRGIESWRFNLPGDEYRGHAIAHTVFDRTLLRAGETVHMKHFMRKHVQRGFAVPKGGELPQAVLVRHRGSGQSYEFPLSWHGDGTAETTMTVPKGAELGFYDVYLEQSPRKKGAGEEERRYPPDGWESGFFRVEAFRVPLMKGVVEPPKEPAVNASSVEVDLYVSHLSGGGAGRAPVKLRTRVRPRSVEFDTYDEYTFANGKVETGVVREEMEDHSNDEDSEEGRNLPAKAPSYRTREYVLNDSGALRARIDDLPKISSPHLLTAELEFRDPNGEIQTVTGRVPLWSSKLLVGVKPDSWSSSADALKFDAVVVDLKGKPVPGAKVSVELFGRKYYSHRKRLVGGFYSYENVNETKSLGRFCEGTTDRRGILECQGKAPVSGNVIIQASVTDDQGNLSAANRDVWVAGKDEWWFEAGDSDRIDLIAEKRSYEPGDVANFQVRAPFRSATVLVTVEREGIIDAYVKKISGKQPQVSVPVKGYYAPNVFVSALCVRGRISGTKPTALFDPGKPAYRLGITEIKVGSRSHELKVKVTTDAPAYKVRGKARVSIKVTRSNGDPPPKGAEVALAAVDEGLLDLMPNNSWKLLEAMMGRRGYEVETSTAQTQVVGRRHYGMKALPAGGGGGMRSARELFDTLLAWKGRVKLDENGEATVEIPLNDSLTSFRIVAVAHAGAGLFGTGQTSIRTTQDLMILSGLPPLVRQGDRFTAGFTVRNASNHPMALTVQAKPAWAQRGYEPIALKLAPGEAREVSWPADVPQGIDSATWEAQVREDGGTAADRIKVTQKVVPSVPVQVYQATLTQVDQELDLPVRMPEQALKGRGGVNIVLRPRLSDGLGGVTRYMKEYPYSCMEQMVSRAIALKDRARWEQIVKVLPSYLDGEGLVKFFPSPWLEGSPVLTSYILSISAEAGKKLPDHLVRQMEKGLTSFVEGKLRRESSFRTADLSIRKLSAIAALAQRGKANAALLSTITIQPKFWPTSAVLDWVTILKKTANLPDRGKRLSEAQEIIRTRLNLQGTVAGFSTEKSDRLWWLMVSTDSNVMRAILAFVDDEAWRRDLPRLVRGALARQSRGHWETTTANAWGVVALDRFSERYEATEVTGSTKAELAQAARSVDWNVSRKGKPMTFPWPDQQAQLTLRHAGKGKPWANIMSLAAIPLKEPVASGYRVKRTVTPVEQRDKHRWSRGDVARVKLEIEAQSEMTWVAVSDPVPAGATVLGSGLGRDSALLTEGEKNRAWPVFEERTFEAYRAYYDFVPKGRLVTEYTVRFNSDGKFRLPPTRVEALYAPEMFGESPNQALSVEK